MIPVLSTTTETSTEILPFKCCWNNNYSTSNQDVWKKRTLKTNLVSFYSFFKCVMRVTLKDIKGRHIKKWKNMGEEEEKKGEIKKDKTMLNSWWSHREKWTAVICRVNNRAMDWIYCMRCLFVCVHDGV